MRTSSLGKQARFESEPSTQDEHVAETEMVSRLLANSRLPITVDLPTAVNRVWERNNVSDRNLTLSHNSEGASPQFWEPQKSSQLQG